MLYKNTETRAVCYTYRSIQAQRRVAYSFLSVLKNRKRKFIVIIMCYVSNVQAVTDEHETFTGLLGS